MASGTLGDSNEDLNSGRRFRWPEDRKVYTRRIRKKAPKVCNGNDTSAVAENPFSAASTASVHTSPLRNGDSSATLASTISVAENPSFAVPDTSAPVSPVRNGDSSVTVAGTTHVEASTVSASENPNNCSVASPLPTGNCRIKETAASEKTCGDHVGQQSPNAAVIKDADLDITLQPREVSLPFECLDKDGDSAPQQLQDKHQNLVNSPGYKSNGSQDLQNSPFPGSDGLHNLQSSSPHNSTNEMLLVSETRTENLSKSPVFHDADLPNGNEVGAAHLSNGDEAGNDGDQIPVSPQATEGNGTVNVNGAVKPPPLVSRIEDRIKIKLCKETPKDEIRNFRNQLECELDQVKRLFMELDSKELQLGSYPTQISNGNVNNGSSYIIPDGPDISGYSHPLPQHTLNNSVDRRYLLKMNPEVNNIGHGETRSIGLARVNSDMGAPRSLEPRTYSRQLSVAVMENNHLGSDIYEKEKRTPKANQYYRNSEFLLGKDRLPSESNKRLKTSNGRKANGETGHSFGFGFDKNKNQLFKSCNSLLQRLMKHRYGWVFNEPVDAKALGLFDYHDIIKHPMDLGTIKTRLSQNWYKAPREFAEDIRLVFLNAMTYNPKGQDVHVMAEQLLNIFEERWAIIESEYTRNWKYQMYQDGGLPTPTSRKVPLQSHFTSAVIAAPPNPGFVPGSLHGPATVSAPAASSVPMYAPAAPQMRNFDRSEPTTSMAVDPKIHRPQVGRTPAPKKPKAKDPNKRDMTYDEKQRLSTHLQGLPPEKLDAIVQIIKKRNTALSQHDDEIEVDIDRVDAETLWELDRFVTNYKKSLSKNKRKAELALQARMAANQNNVLTNSTPATAETQIQSGAEKSIALADGEKHGYDRSRSSSSSSSSSDSGSSSSDSDSDSSSVGGSDEVQSPRT